MARPKAKTPAMRYHLSGQAVCTIDGRDFYLGKHGTAEALARNAVLIAEYQSGNLSLGDSFDQETLFARAKALISTPDELVASHQALQIVTTFWTNMREYSPVSVA